MLALPQSVLCMREGDTLASVNLALWDVDQTAANTPRVAP